MWNRIKRRPIIKALPIIILLKKHSAGIDSKVKNMK
jgi:hypothetical protein